MEISLLVTQLVVLYLIFRDFRLSRKVGRIHKYLIRKEVRGFMKVMSKQINELLIDTKDKNNDKGTGKKKSANGKNKHKN